MPRIEVPDRQVTEGQLGVGGKMSGTLEFLAGDFGDDACFGLDTDRRYGGQDRVKRVGLHEGFYLD